VKEHEVGMKTADLARKHRISEATIYNWKANGGMDVSEAKRLKALAVEKKRLADQMLDAAALRESPPPKHAAVAHLQAVMSLSERRACSIVGADRKMIRYCSSRPRDAELRGGCATSPTGGGVSATADCSSCCDGRASRRRSTGSTGLSRGRARRPQAAGSPQGTRVPILIEARPNTRWSLDFVHDQFANGWRFRISNIVDLVAKACLGAIPDTSISGRRVARELTAIVSDAASRG
jgi:putative transposase